MRSLNCLTQKSIADMIVKANTHPGCTVTGIRVCTTALRRPNTFNGLPTLRYWLFWASSGMPSAAARLIVVAHNAALGRGVL